MKWFEISATIAGRFALPSQSMIYTSNFSVATEQCQDFTAIALRSPAKYCPCTGSLNQMIVILLFGIALNLFTNMAAKLSKYCGYISYQISSVLEFCVLRRHTSKRASKVIC
jgi:hypothetical protein